MRWWWISVWALGLAACGSSHSVDPGLDAGPPPELPAPNASAAQTVGPEGGTLELGTLTLEVPAGALASETELRVRVDAAPVEAPFTGFSPVFHFEPEGIVFARPVTVRLPFAGDTDTATIFWTTLADDAYAPLPTQVEGHFASAEITHFSSAFVGTACDWDDCCGRANGDLDVLLVVDNSNSMAEEQSLLAEQIPRMAHALATGDIDGDGAQDFPALRTVRMGTVSTDMGTGGPLAIPTCSSGLGDDGILRTQGGASDGCAASYPNYAELDTDDPAADVAGFVEQVSCVAVLGTGGCGFEQQLEAALKALTPSSSPLRFADGTTGQGDRANAGFLRDHSLLATIVVTDENDCSVSDPALFDPASTSYGEPLNLRCFAHPEALHPVSRYADGLHALRREAIFGIIAGVPTDLVSDPSVTPNYDAILADPRMVETVDPSSATTLLPSCNVDGLGIAMPPRRLVEAAQHFGANGVVQSICQEDFTPAIDAVLERVAARVSGRCGP